MPQDFERRISNETVRKPFQSSDTLKDRQSFERGLRPVVSREEILENERYMHAKGLYGPWRCFILESK
jgi:hypothetical protein